jgi:hypothetical protein
MRVGKIIKRHRRNKFMADIEGKINLAGTIILKFSITQSKDI